MSWVAVAVGAAGVISSMDSGRRAANTAADAARMQQQQYGQTRSDLMPWMQAGQVALPELQQLLGVGTGPGGGFNPNAPLVKPFSLQDFQASPAYQFNLAQGQQAIDKAAASRGNFYAPQTLQDISKFSQGLASNEFINAYNMYNQNQGNIYSRLNALSGTGQNAAAGIGGFGADAATRAGQFGIQGANATNDWNNIALQNLAVGAGDAWRNYQQRQILQQNQQPSYGMTI